MLSDARGAILDDRDRKLRSVSPLRLVHPKRKFKIDVSGDTEGCWDRPRIGQALSNLLGNAVQYGFTDLPIDVTIKGGKDDVLLCVHNEGVHVAEGLIRGVFDSLVRGETDQSDLPSSNNLGLGFYITKEIVSLHGGTIGVTSSERGGTTFTERFPRFERESA
jgi:signal transduction histidine kinase